MYRVLQSDLAGSIGWSLVSWSECVLLFCPVDQMASGILPLLKVGYDRGLDTSVIPIIISVGWVFFFEI